MAQMDIRENFLGCLKSLIISPTSHLLFLSTSSVFKKKENVYFRKLAKYRNIKE